MEIINTIATILGSGLLSATITIYYQKRTHIKQMDYETRQKTLETFKKAYASISRLYEYTTAYSNSKKTGKKRIWIFEKGTQEERTTDEIKIMYQNEYNTFIKIFIQPKNEGYELFITQKMVNNLECFWRNAREFNENTEALNDKTKIEEFNSQALKTTDCMEKMFGLTNR
ncbi:MAG: hypothetical protein LBE76_07370 [Nitrososphaerota archaeon]|jgi:ABC-type sugar transport system ATPase subunit|nr:hypothetical protein [Nitrososphaerota archaeon]